MRKADLSSTIILILASESNLSLSLSLENELKKKIGAVDVVSNLHQAVIHAILTEPDFVFIEVSPQNFSGLQLLDVLKRLKGVKKNPLFFIFAEKKMKESFRQTARNILFLDDREPSAILEQIKAALEEASSERADAAFPVYRKELDILEKLGQLGVLKKT